MHKRPRALFCTHAPHAPHVQAIIVVPTMELGVQCALQVFRMLGGNLTSQKEREPGDDTNIFTYVGPKNIKAGQTITII